MRSQSRNVTQGKEELRAGTLKWQIGTGEKGVGTWDPFLETPEKFSGPEKRVPKLQSTYSKTLVF